MAFRVPIQSAPELRGVVTQPDGWSGTGTAIMVLHGRYSSEEAASYTFTVDDAGTIDTTATLTVSWVESNSSETGRLDVGTDKYTGGDKILFHRGLSVSFLAAGTLVAAETDTASVIPAWRIRGDHYRVEGDALPDDVLLLSGDRATADVGFETDSGNIAVHQVAQRHMPKLAVAFQDGVAKRAMERMEGARHEVTVFENYDRDTVFLMRGGGINPMIGQQPTFTRSNAGTGWDAYSGLFKRHPANTPRIYPGFQLESDELSNPNERNHVPLRYNHVGKCFAVSAVAQNLMVRSHPVETLANAGWLTTVGAPTITFRKGMAGVLDPDDSGWPDGFTDGVLEVAFPTSGDTITTAEIVVTPADTLLGSIWTKGRGVVLYRTMTGIGVAGTFLGPINTSTYWNLDSDWQRAEVEITIPAGHTRLAFSVTSLDVTSEPVIYLSAMSLYDDANSNVQHSSYEPSEAAGSEYTRAVETCTINDPIPFMGTLSFLWQDNGNDHSFTYPLLETTDAVGNKFAVRFDASAGAEVIEFHTDGSGAGNALTGAFGGGNTKVHQWWHVAVTWDVSTSNLLREVFVNGVSVGSDTSAFVEGIWGPLEVAPVIAGLERASGYTFEEIRMDSRVLSAAEILDLYERYSTDGGTHMHRLYGGRRFRIDGLTDRWITPAAPGKMLADLSLVQSGTHEHSVVGEK